MSTKIYTGFRFKPDMSLMDIHHKIMDFRAEVREIVNQEVAKWLAQNSVRMIDRLSAEPVLRSSVSDEDREDLKKFGPLTVSHLRMMSRAREMSKNMRRDPDIDFTFNISILPISPGKILGIYFAENQKLIQQWIDKEFVTEYHYQNSTDRPQNIDYKEWKRRERDWDKALPGVGIPAHNGFEATIMNHHYPTPDISCVVQHLPKLNGRATPIAREILLDKRASHIPPDAPTSTWAGEIDNFREWLSSKEGKKSLRETIKIVKSYLKRRISRNDLIGSDKC